MEAALIFFPQNYFKCHDTFLVVVFLRVTSSASFFYSELEGSMLPKPF